MSTSSSSCGPRLLQDYWKQRKAVADQVVAYAQDISSGRETEDEGAKKYAAARAAYEARMAEYDSVLAELQAGGTELAAARQALEAAQQATDAASAVYEEARQKYLDALVSTQSGNVDFYRGQIEQKYAELLAASGMTTNDTELIDASTQYFSAARRHGFDLAVNSAWQNASALVKGRSRVRACFPCGLEGKGGADSGPGHGTGPPRGAGGPWSCHR